MTNNNWGCLLVRSFGVFLASVLIAVHTVNNLDLGDKQSPEMMTIEVVK